MLTFITAKRAVLSSLTCAGLMATVLGIVNRGSGLRFHVPAPRVHINAEYSGSGFPFGTSCWGHDRFVTSAAVRLSYIGRASCNSL